MPAVWYAEYRDRSGLLGLRYLSELALYIKRTTYLRAAVVSEHLDVDRHRSQFARYHAAQTMVIHTETVSAVLFRD